MSRWEMIGQIFKRRFLALVRTMMIVLALGLWFRQIGFVLMVALYVAYRFYQLKEKYGGV
ncbi:hypothetical protein ABID29_001935 [Streptococcus rupicaprae]|uniref:DUF3272 family protein n=1 Tax=Streptococcus rupicaprae TaxID=759619 RepID=A0ABV2FJU9_9STRE